MKRTGAHGRYRSDTAFLDMVFNMTLAFAFLFIIAILLIRPPTTVKANIERKAEFMITMTWPDEALDDVDMWVLLPTGQKVHYRQKDVQHAALDRDDRGGHGDTIWKDEFKEEKILIKQNEEIVTIRAIVPGRYVVAAHLFAAYAEVDGFKTGRTMPYDVDLKILKLNPRIITIGSAKVQMERTGQQGAFMAFVVQADGSVTEIELNPPDEIVEILGKTGQ